MSGRTIPGHLYLLPRDASERLRLNEQHRYLIKFVYDGRSVYKEDVVSRLQNGGKVLDSGTGTAIWLQDLAREVPESVELHGIDLSPKNFPEEADRPSNLHLHIGSLTNLPAEWSNQFDLINQRFLIAGLSKSEWPQAVAEMFRVLKPGGVVQLAEREPTYMSARVGSAMARHDELFDRMYKTLGFNHMCATDLPGMLEAAGFTNISDDTKINPIGRKWGEDGECGARIYGGAYENMGPVLVEEGLVGSAAEYEGLLSDLRKEWGEEGGQQPITTTIPFWPYRLFFLYIEPATALLGAFFAGRPAEYLALCIPHTTYTKPLLTNPPVEVNIALYQLSNIFLFVSLNEYFVLSSTNSIKTWRALLGCLLIADIGHLLTNLPLGASVLWR
ncbi:S-adenosyl-L-methionine-dependent methyltransferase, partial [Schizopora paradoxa]